MPIEEQSRVNRLLPPREAVHSAILEAMAANDAAEKAADEALRSFDEEMESREANAVDTNATKAGSVVRSPNTAQGWSTVGAEATTDVNASTRNAGEHRTLFHDIREMHEHTARRSRLEALRAEQESVARREQNKSAPAPHNIKIPTLGSGSESCASSEAKLQEVMQQQNTVAAQARIGELREAQEQVARRARLEALRAEQEAVARREQHKSAPAPHDIKISSLGSDQSDNGCSEVKLQEVTQQQDAIATQTRIGELREVQEQVARRSRLEALRAEQEAVARREQNKSAPAPHGIKIPTLGSGSESSEVIHQVTQQQNTVVAHTRIGELREAQEQVARRSRLEALRAEQEAVARREQNKSAPAPLGIKTPSLGSGSEGSEVKLQEVTQQQNTVVAQARIGELREVQEQVARRSRLEALRAEQEAVARREQNKSAPAPHNIKIPTLGSGSESCASSGAKLQEVTQQQNTVVAQARTGELREAQEQVARRARLEALRAEQEAVARREQHKSAPAPHDIKIPSLGSGSESSSEAKLQEVTQQQITVAAHARIGELREVQEQVARRSRLEALRAEQEAVARREQHKSAPAPHEIPSLGRDSESSESSESSEAKLHEVTQQQSTVAPHARIGELREAQEQVARRSRLEALRAEQEAVARREQNKSAPAPHDIKISSLGSGQSDNGCSEVKLQEVTQQQDTIATQTRTGELREAQEQVARRSRLEALRAEQEAVARREQNKSAPAPHDIKIPSLGSGSGSEGSESSEVKLQEVTQQQNTVVAHARMDQLREVQEQVAHHSRLEALRAEQEAVARREQNKSAPAPQDIKIPRLGGELNRDPTPCTVGELQVHLQGMASAGQGSGPFIDENIAGDGGEALLRMLLARVSPPSTAKALASEVDQGTNTTLSLFDGTQCEVSTEVDVWTAEEFVTERQLLDDHWASQFQQEADLGDQLRVRL